jgi:hypothetical protein
MTLHPYDPTLYSKTLRPYDPTLYSKTLRPYDPTPLHYILRLYDPMTLRPYIIFKSIKLVLLNRDKTNNNFTRTRRIQHAASLTRRYPNKTNFIVL